MPKETIRRLAVTTERLLVAGAHLAAGDPELAKDKKALDALAKQIGDKAPVIGQLAEAAGRALRAKDAAELVSLAARVSQVRAAQAELAVCGTGSAPLAPAMELGTPCNARDLYDLHAALTTTGAGRDERVSTALARGGIADLRLADAVVHALGDPYLGDRVEKEILPHFGRALLEPLHREFDPKGGTPDARRFRAIAALDPDRAGETVRRALMEGSPLVRQSAFELLAGEFPGHADLEPCVLDAAAKERSEDVRRAAIRALGRYASDAAFSQLVAALDVDGVAAQAIEGLSRTRHPDAVPRLLRELDASMQKPAKGKTKAKDTARTQAILQSLSGHRDPEIIRRALALLESHPGAAASAAVQSDDRAVLIKVADLLLGNASDAFAPAVRAAEKLGADEAFRRLSAVFLAKDRDTDVGGTRVDTVVDALGGYTDPRWTDILIGVMNADLGLGVTGKMKSLLGVKSSRSGPVTLKVIEAIGRRGDATAAKPLLKALASEPTLDLRVAIIQSLGGLGDPSVVKPILECASAAKFDRIPTIACFAIRAVAVPATVGLVRKFLAGLEADFPPRAPFEYLLSALEKKFPGE